MKEARSPRQVKAGKLRHTILIQQDQGNTNDNFGAPVPKWATVRTTYASIEPITGRELWQGMQIRPDVTHGHEMRYSAALSVTPDMRILFGSGCWQAGNDLSVGKPTNCRVFQIKYVLSVDEAQRKLLLQSTEQVT